VELGKKKTEAKEKVPVIPITDITNIAEL
jgi:hypothetical protein